MMLIPTNTAWTATCECGWKTSLPLGLAPMDKFTAMLEHRCLSWEVLRLVTAPGQLRIGRWDDEANELHVRWLMVSKKNHWPRPPADDEVLR